jgi:hypothetical protein
VTLSATANDNAGGSGVASVSFLVDGAVVGSDTTSPYSFSWNSRTLVSGSHSIQARAQDGAGNQATSGSVTVNVQNSPAGTSFEGESGVVTAPFTAAGGSISQSSNTGVSDGGRAIYLFAVPTNGNYVVTALVNAPGEGANSFYLNIDGEPTDPAMIWDVPVTSGFQNQVASWRGSGTADANEFVPKIFSLSAGQHILTIVGREPNAAIDNIEIELLTPPSPPTNLILIGP